MNPDLEIKQRISAYLDQEVSPEEKAMVERLMAEDPRWKRYYQELSHVSLSLRAWLDVTPSPDLERRLKALPDKEGWLMNALHGILDKKVLGGVLVGAIAVVAVNKVLLTREATVPPDMSGVRSVAVTMDDSKCQPSYRRVLWRRLGGELQR